MNLFRLEALPEQETELFETLLSTPDLKLERIVSAGQTTPPAEWYDQDWPEWVCLLQGQARLAYADASEQLLQAGDVVLIPAHRRHRVVSTSVRPPCIWLALHFADAETKLT